MTIEQLTIDLPQGGAVVESTAAWYEPFAALYSHYPIIAVLLAMMFVDILTGIVKSLVQREMSSKIGAKGMNKKCATLGVVAAAWLCELIFPKVGGQTIPWGQTVALWYCYVEAISIIENAGRAGAPVPKGFLQEVQRVRDKEDAESAVVAVHVTETNGAAIKDAVQQLKDSDRVVVHDVVDRIGGKLQTLEADVKEVRKAQDSGILKSTELPSPPRKEA